MGCFGWSGRLGEGGLTDEMCQEDMSSSSVGSVGDSAAVFVTPTRRRRYQWTYGSGLTLIDKSHLGSSIGVTGQGGRSTEFKEPVPDWDQVVTRRGGRNRGWSS